MRGTLLVSVLVIGCGAREMSAPSSRARDAAPANPTDASTVTASAEWACLDHPTVLVDRAPQPVQYRVAVVDADTNATVDGLSAAACDTMACGPNAAVVTAQAGGLYAVSFPFGFSSAYLKLLAPGYVPLDYFLGGPMIGTPGGSYVVQGLPIAMHKSGLLDAQKAGLLVRALDCEGAPTLAATVLLGDDKLSPQQLVAVDAGNYQLTATAPDGRAYARLNARLFPGIVEVFELRNGLEQWGQ